VTLHAALFQVAYNAIFNPALPKSACGDGLPLMLRDVKGVSDFQLRFLQDKQGIFKTTQVSARLSGSRFEIECRCCSYCGSCFSGRFMELDSTHQRAGGWKEITDKIHAGNFSWKGLKGYVTAARLPADVHIHGLEKPDGFVCCGVVTVDGVCVYRALPTMVKRAQWKMQTACASPRSVISFPSVRTPDELLRAFWGTGEHERVR
jgi:hypothetical protein